MVEGASDGWDGVLRDDRFRLKTALPDSPTPVDEANLLSSVCVQAYASLLLLMPPSDGSLRGLLGVLSESLLHR